jgi:hypothetical protein
MLVVSIDLEERIAFSLRSDWLINQCFEADQCSKDHLEESIVDSPFPVVIVFLHHWMGFGACSQNKLLNVLQELVSNDLVFLRELSDGLSHMFVRIGGKLGWYKRRFSFPLEVKVFQDHSFFDASDYVNYHS